MATKQINLLADFPDKTASNIITENVKGIGYGDAGDASFTPDAILHGASGLNSTEIQALIDQNLKKTYKIPDVDFTSIGYTSTAIRASKTFIAQRVVIWHKTITNWTVVPGSVEVGLSLAADVAANANDWDDSFSQVLNAPTSSFEHSDAASIPRVSTGFDVFYVGVTASGATATALVADIFIEGIEVDT